MATDDNNALLFDLADQPVRFADTRGPAAGQMELQPFGLTDAFLGVTQDIFK